MSERKDDLSQWRAYGGGENGVSIGFDSEVLQRPPFRHAFLAPVCYDEQKQKAFAADLAKWTVEYFRQGFARRQKVGRRCRATTMG